MALTSDAFARRSGLMVVEEIVAFEIRVVSLPPSPEPRSPDFSGNGVVGLEDFFIFAESFGMEVGTSSPPPDPPAGLAPADQAVFDSLAVGKQIVDVYVSESLSADCVAISLAFRIQHL